VRRTRKPYLLILTKKRTFVFLITRDAEAVSSSRRQLVERTGLHPAAAVSALESIENQH
jgi:hypothetical protein